MMDIKENGKDTDKNDHEITIIINTREFTVSKEALSYEEIIIMALGQYTPQENWEYSISYSFVHGNETGTVDEGESIKPRKGMVFIVTRTNKS